MLEDIGIRAKEASRELAGLCTIDKNRILECIKKSVEKNRKDILEANAVDMGKGEGNLSEAFLDRLKLDDDRIDSMISSIDYIMSLDDPIGKVSEMNTMPNGLIVGKKTVPLGVIAIIYESRPNVTLDASLLALKSSNVLILKGGKESLNSNVAISDAIRKGIGNAGFNADFIQLVEDTSRETTNKLMKLNEYVDVLIPRGSKRLINSVVQNATIPVIATGDGNCHVFVDESADIDMALSIIENAKTQRTGVCNAMESLLVHKNLPDEFYSGLKTIIEKYDIIVHGDKFSKEKLPFILDATEEDYGKEYLNMEFSMKMVENVDEAIDHIALYSTGHSESIVTNNYENSQKFLNKVDSACVYVNASTRFTDGGELGMGAEMGISTQKLHARGPLGLNQLTSSKYIIFGSGQIRK